MTALPRQSLPTPSGEAVVPSIHVAIAPDA